jgi:hypothetical protein
MMLVSTNPDAFTAFVYAACTSNAFSSAIFTYFDTVSNVFFLLVAFNVSFNFTTAARAFASAFSAFSVAFLAAANNLVAVSSNVPSVIFSTVGEAAAAEAAVGEAAAGRG